MVFATIHDEAKAETINLSSAIIRNRGVPKIPSMDSPDRYTNNVWLMGDSGTELDVNGVFIPETASTGRAFPAGLDAHPAWVTSSGADPVPIIERWERVHQRLQYNDETGSLTSVNVMFFHSKNIPGIPRENVIYYSLKLRAGIDD